MEFTKKWASENMYDLFPNCTKKLDCVYFRLKKVIVCSQCVVTIRNKYKITYFGLLWEQKTGEEINMFDFQHFPFKPLAIPVQQICPIVLY